MCESTRYVDVSRPVLSTLESEMSRDRCGQALAMLCCGLKPAVSCGGLRALGTSGC